MLIGDALRRVLFVGSVLLVLTCRAGQGEEPRLTPVARTGEAQLLRDVVYDADHGKACRLDLALPASTFAGPRPAIVVIHGGGWVEGDKSSFSTTEKRIPGNILDFAEQGFVAATINYRMSKEAPYPAAIDDCRAAVRWLRAHAQEYQIDAEHIGALGNSAGGHLALLLAVMPEPVMPAPADAGDPGAAKHPSRVQAAVSDSGVIDLVADHRAGVLRGVIEMFMGGPPEGERLKTYREASPSSYANRKTPPLLLIYGEVDRQVGAATADQFIAELSRGGNTDITYHRLAGVDHCPYSLIGVPFLKPLVTEFFQRTLVPKTQSTK